MEGKEPDVMRKRPRDPKEPIVNKGMKKSVAFRSIFVCAGSLGAFLYGLNLYDDATAMSMCFFTLVATELLVSYPSRTEKFMGFNRKLLENKFLNISMGFSLLILIATMYIPFLNVMFNTVPLNASQFVVSSAFVLVPIFGSELSKRFSLFS
jgi:Ca2+-transporting ATPase